MKKLKELSRNLIPFRIEQENYYYNYKIFCFTVASIDMTFRG